MTKILLIGQAPGHSPDPPTPLLNGQTGRKLMSLFGLDKAEYIKHFDKINVLDFWPGKSGKGDRFPIRDAKKAAAEKSILLSSGRILFIGIGTASAFGFKSIPLRWRKFNGYTAAILPHPSGINHWWNDPYNKKKAKRFMSKVAHRCGHATIL